jgi:hypothetical protein
MSKLLSVLIAGLFAAGAAMAQGTTPGAGSTAGSKSTSGSTNYNNNTASSTNANLNNNTNTNANNVNVYGPGSNKLARQQQPAGTTGVSMMPGHGQMAKNDKVKDKKDKSAYYPQDKQQTAANDKDKDKPCPPGLEKKNNGCMPPGQANHHETQARNNDTRAMGAGPRMDRDRDHDKDRDRDDDRRHRKHHGGHGEH